MANNKGDQARFAEDFRERCRAAGLAFTHQRQVIFRIASSRKDHPTPEAIYDHVRREIPAISLATVYKNLKTFVETGLLHEVSLHHGSLRLDPNPDLHHHLVCARCKAIIDLPEDAIEPVRLTGALPEGFRVERHSVEIIGVCAKCARLRTPHTS